METNINTPVASVPSPVQTPPMPVVSNYQQIPEVNQPKEFPWKVVIASAAAGLAILLLVVWFVIMKFNLLPTQVKTWNGIVPGQTTKTEVVAKLGQPREEKTEVFGQIMTYDSGIVVLPNTVIYDQDTGKVSGILVAVSDKNKAEQYYQEMQKLGKPEKIMYSTYLQFSKIYIFAAKGVSYSANESTKTVDAIHYFQPTTLQNYLSKFGSFFSEENPYQL